MNRFRPIILAFVIAIAAFLAYGLWTMPKPQPADAPGFSSARVIKDIEVISKNHHSVAHPQERAEVREYLVGRLEKLGADSVFLFEYDSLTGPENKHVKYTFDAANILAEFAPVQESEDTTWLMLVAHYDSRYSQPMPKDTVWSYGAADDGYGVGTILETVSQTLKQREHWKQGLKVLFTDAEEVGMKGMIALWENDRQVFDNVGLMINIEARGPWGPCLLFETCPGSSKVMKLYADAAKYPYTYSLTTVVYSFMPNFTDFTIVKDEVPGMNFSTIADVNHYHTDKDNFSNVNAKTIQHYGAQILPIAMKYLTSEEYRDKDYFRTDEDTVNFTIPALGLLNFSKTTYMVINIVLAVIFLLLFAVESLRGRCRLVKALKYAGVIVLSAFGILAVGELVAYLSCVVSGATFKPFGIVLGVTYDNVVMLVSVVVIAAVATVFYLFHRNAAVRLTAGSLRKNAATNAAAHHAYNVLYGALLPVFVFNVVLLFTLGENMMFFIPLFCVTVAMVLYHLTSLKLWLVAAIALVLLHAFSFYFALSMALTIGAFGAVAMLAFFDLMILIPLADIYLLSYKK